MWTGVTHSSDRAWQAGGDRAEHQYANRHDHQGHHQQLHFPGLQFLAEVFRSTTDHQAGEEHRDQHVEQHAVEPGANAAEDHFADHHVDQGHHAAQWVEAVVHAVYRTVRRGRGGHRPEHGGGGAETRFLAFQRRGLLDSDVVQGRVRLVFSPQRGRAADQEQRQHAGDDRATLTQVLHVMAEGEDQRDGDQNDRGHFEQVAPRRRVLERMRRVHAEEATTVGAQLLDGNLTGSRSQRNHLVNTLHSHCIHVLRESLRHALPDQVQRQQQAQRQQAVEGGAGHVDPEVAQSPGGFAADAATQRDQYRQTGGGADEVLHGEASHLAQVAQGRFAAVGLPVGVGHEADGGVERQRPLLTRQVLRVERQVVLEQQDREQQQETREVEGNQGQGVFLPALFGLRIDAGQTITTTFDRTENRRQPGALPFHHLVVEAPEKRRRDQNQGKKTEDQPIVITVHSRS
ncbi:hypothetical protein D3C81_1194090 [compost metagenome]